MSAIRAATPVPPVPRRDLDRGDIDPQVWRTVWTVMVGALAVLFETTIVAVALHTLAADLHTSVDTIQWVSTGYLLALAVTIPLTGWAGRRFGGKRLWIAGLAVFLFGSVAASLAPNAAVLIACRVVQGLGGGILVPLMSTLVMQAAAGRGIGRIMSVVSLPAILGPVLGPVIGGLILNHWHWSWMFWVNVPFCVAGMVLAVRFLPADAPTDRADGPGDNPTDRPGAAPANRIPLDTTGFLLFAPGLAAVLFGLSRAADGFLHSGAILPLTTGLILLAAFTARTLRRRGPGLIDLRLLRHWPLASSALLLFLAGVTLYGAMLVIPLYLQQLRGLTVLGAGLLLLPQGIGTLASRALAGRLSDAMGARWLVVAGFLITLAGTVPFAYAGATAGLWWLGAVLFVRGVGLGVVTVPLMALGFRGLSHDEIPDASIITRVAQQVGGSFGAAVLTVILAAGPLAAAFHRSFWWAIGFTAAGAVISLALPGAKPGAKPAAEPAVGPAPRAER